MRSHAKAVVAVLAMLLTLAFVSAANAAAPVVSVENASDVTYTSAKVKGTLNPEGKSTTFRFQYVTQATFEAEGFANPVTAIEEGGYEGSEEIEFERDLGGLAPNTTYHLRLYAENEDGSSEAIAASTFATPFLATPIASTDPATPVGYTQATLNGKVDPDGADAAIGWYFEYSSDEGANWTYAGGGEISAEEAANATEPIAVSATPQCPDSCLTNDQDYVFRLNAVNAAGQDTSPGPPYEEFATLEVTKPIVTLDPITTFGSETASFEGEVNPGAPEAAPTSADVEAAFATTYRFECTPACPGTPEAQTLAADDTAHEVSFEAEDLEPDTDYVIKLFASNKGGEEVAERSFRTSTAGPELAPGTVGALTHNGARLTAFVDPNNSPTTASFEYDTDPSFASPTLAPSGEGSEVTGNGQKVAYADVSGLSPNTTYHWRVSVQSAEGSEEAEAPKSFETWPTPPDPNDCPNAEIRREQGIPYVSNCRAYELVSTEKKFQGATVGATVSRSGDRALFIGRSDTASDSELGDFLADRTPSGWKVRSATPPLSAFAPGEEELHFIGASPELDAFSILAGRGYLREGPRRLYRYEPDSGELTAGWQMPAPNVWASLAVASDDQTRVVGPVGATAFQANYFELSAEAPTVVTLMPDDSPPDCGVWTAQEENGLHADRWISTDGNRYFFTSRGDDCGGPAHLYVREGGVEGSTTLISAPPLSGDDFEPKVIRATPDGAQVFYVTRAKLDPTDANETNDVYLYRAGSGNTCISCAAPEADVSPGTNFGGGGGSFASALSADTGERVYFTSKNVLAAGASKGKENLYVWRAAAPDELGFVAPGDAMATASFRLNAFPSASGEVFVFGSRRPELDALTDSENDGQYQYYRYDDRDGSLVCVSCAPSAVDASSVAHPEANKNGMSGFFSAANENASNLTRDGRSFFFDTSTPLVPEDRDANNDVYEWRDGRLALVTDGHSGGLSIFTLGFGEDGRGVVLQTRAKLTADPTADYGDVYVARVNGGFPPPSTPTPCAGDGCRGPQDAPPADPGPVTPSFSGPPNPKPCAKGKVRKRGSCVKKGKARKKQAKQRKNKKQGKGANAKQGGSK